MFRAISGPGMALGLCLLALGSAVASAARQQPGAAQMVDVDRVGPKVGEALPEFSLRDQNGHVESLKSLLGPRGTLIVFFRSADW
jgi:cytochrome oxidase Cu insertion factor (SCO1/SenC/PrrC family)